MDEELRPTFVAEARRRLATIADVTVPRRERVETAHGLKGAAGVFGSAELRVMAADLEMALRGGDDGAAAALHGRLAAAVESLDRPPGLDSPAALSPSRPADRPLAMDWSREEADMLRALFLEEAEEHLRRIADAQVELGRDPDARPAIDELFRGVHTLKGSAGSIGLEAVSNAAHELEELCAEIRAGRLRAVPGILDRIDDGVAGLRALLDGARAAAGAGVKSSPGAGPGPADATPEEDRGAVPDAALSPGETGERGGLVDRRRSPDRRVSSERTLRVESHRLDTLLDGVGELVILRSRIERRTKELEAVGRDLATSRDALSHAAAGLRGSAPDLDEIAGRAGELEIEFTDAIAHLDRATAAIEGETESLRRTTAALEEELRRARLIRLDWLYHRVEQILRPLARAEGKQVEIRTSGGDAELDKGVVEQITDPFLHLIRNALAHGIETPDERRAAGKPEVGHIDLGAHVEGEMVVLEIADDGRGIDRAAIRRRLLQAGRLDPRSPPNETQMLAVLFEPGFSTRDAADDIAGRGVGLDVVKEAVTRLGGSIAIESAPGAGTRFRLRLPLSTAISRALLFKLGGQVYALPASAVLEAVPLPAELLDGPDVEIAGARLPVVRLQTLLGAEMPPGRRMTAVALQHGDRRFVVTCDRIIGPRVIVVRSLGPLLAPLPLYAGVTVSGSGKAQLVLDLGTLAEASLSGAALRPRRDRPDPSRRVLLVDDSRLTRRSGSAVLVQAGYQAVTADDGWEAWELLGERRFDAVVTDLEMPRMDGFELLARIRSEPTLRDMPVVVLSSRTSDTMRERARAAGANAFVAKSPSKRALIDAVASAIAGT